MLTKTINTKQALIETWAMEEYDIFFDQKTIRPNLCDYQKQQKLLKTRKKSRNRGLFSTQEEAWKIRCEGLFRDLLGNDTEHITPNNEEKYTLVICYQYKPYSQKQILQRRHV